MGGRGRGFAPCQGLPGACAHLLLHLPCHADVLLLVVWQVHGQDPWFEMKWAPGEEEEEEEQEAGDGAAAGEQRQDGVA